MTFLELVFLFVKLFAAGILTLYSYLNTRHSTAPKLVWWMFFTAYLIWLIQTSVNGYVLYHHVVLPSFVNILNEKVLQLIKLFLFIGAAVMMNQTYKDREKAICLKKS